jgi:thioesterase domain-containing protein
MSAALRKGRCVDKPEAFASLDAVTVCGENGVQANGSVASLPLMAESAPKPASCDVVAEIWARLLGHKARNDSARLIDLSVGVGRVYRLLTEIERETGVALPISVVFQAPTLKDLSEVVRQRAWPRFEPQVLMKSGKTDTPSLMIFPGLGGSVFQLLDLARLIVHPGATYIMQQQGLSGDAPPHTTIDAMAHFQLAAIKAVQPTGPYNLLGYSLGGIVVLEVARMLCARGEDVAFIGMIEPGLPETLWPASVRVGFLLNRVKHHWQTVRAQATTADAVGYIAGHMRPLVGRLSRLLGTDAGGWSPYTLDGLPNALATLRNANIQAVYAYKLRPFHGAVKFFRSELGDPLSCDPMKVWPRYLSQLTVWTMPGGHETILRGKHVKILADRISRLLGADPEASSPAVPDYSGTVIS